MPIKSKAAPRKSAESKPYVSVRNVPYGPNEVALAVRMWNHAYPKTLPTRFGVSRRHISQVIALKSQPCDKLLAALAITKVVA